MEDLQKQINEIKQELQLLKTSSSIPFPVDQAFRTRLGIREIAKITPSSKGATSEDVTINVGLGVGIYSVLGAPNGFLQTTINGIVYYIPIYT